ncbi:MAG TPA: hypothetical protein VJV23_03970 [Candidatus Polarisedimenticolia bacterium]|nr:hypothetical protein [Candidatus Polarisedimenticolia bacterium]
MPRTIKQTLENYLIRHRKRSRLTQAELAYLLGVSDGTKVCHHEVFTKRPSVRSVFIYEILFDAPARDLFAGHYEEARRLTLKRIAVLIESIARKEKDPFRAHKVAFLRAVLARSGVSALEEA